MVQRQIPKGNKAKIAKLAAAAHALTSGQDTYLSITKLTCLKSLCREPEVANQFVFFLAHQTQVRMETAPRLEHTSMEPALSPPQRRCWPTLFNSGISIMISNICKKVSYGQTQEQTPP